MGQNCNERVAVPTRADHDPVNFVMGQNCPIKCFNGPGLWISGPLARSSRLQPPTSDRTGSPPPSPGGLRTRGGGLSGAISYPRPYPPGAPSLSSKPKSPPGHFSSLSLGDARRREG
jgi:hypothetical protein